MAMERVVDSLLGADFRVRLERHRPWRRVRGQSRLQGSADLAADEGRRADAGNQSHHA